MMWRVRVSWGIAEGVVHSVQHGISAWTQVRGALRNVSQRVKKPLPELAHRKHFVSRVTVQKESLAEQGQIPVPYKCGQYNHNRVN